MHSAISADQLLRDLSLAVARNQVGANKPVHEIARLEGLTPSEYDDIAANPMFQRYVEEKVQELTENGFSYAAKAAVLAEAGLPFVYHILSDPDQAGLARLKAHEQLQKAAEKVLKITDTGAGGNGNGGFSVVINLPGTTNSTPETIVLTAKNDENNVQTLKIDKKPRDLPFVEPDDYVYAGDDFGSAP